MLEVEDDEVVSGDEALEVYRAYLAEENNDGLEPTT